MLEVMLIQGPESIGDSSAPDELISRLRKTEDTDGIARAALNGIQAKSDDPMVKQKILAALSGH
jgi:hypothetical protein